MKTPRKLYAVVSKKAKSSFNASSDVKKEYSEADRLARSRRERCYLKADDWRVVPFNVDSAPRN